MSTQKLFATTIYILESLGGSIIARFVFPKLPLLSRQQISAFPTAILLFTLAYYRDNWSESLSF